MNESQLHQHIYARSVGLVAGGSNEIVVGPGDDAAVIKSATGELALLTVDQLVEGRHFTSDTGINLIARKAIARSVSDIAAMGGTPSWALATGVLPKDYQLSDALFDALSRWAKHWHCPLIGGDIATHSSPDHPLTLSVTVGGSMNQDAKPILRSGAQPGDQIYITGPLGNSFKSNHHLNFEPRVAVGQWAAKNNAHAMMDISDGLGRDSHRIAVASNVRIEIDASKVSMNPGCKNWKQAVSEGEDYELLIALDPKADIANAPCKLLGSIGTVRACNLNEKPGSTIVDPGGVFHDAEQLGWDH
ncbi:MAG: thiamine-phosphate kinase [Phycisphaerales bacterium]|nr:thiamine-phosphate kinase [Phycisphaerales bacterium]